MGVTLEGSCDATLIRHEGCLRPLGFDGVGQSALLPLELAEPRNERLGEHASLHCPDNVGYRLLDILEIGLEPPHIGIVAVSLLVIGRRVYGKGGEQLVVVEELGKNGGDGAFDPPLADVLLPAPTRLQVVSATIVVISPAALARTISALHGVAALATEQLSSKPVPVGARLIDLTGDARAVPLVLGKPFLGGLERVLVNDRGHAAFNLDVAICVHARIALVLEYSPKAMNVEGATAHGTQSFGIELVSYGSEPFPCDILREYPTNNRRGLVIDDVSLVLSY